MDISIDSTEFTIIYEVRPFCAFAAIGEYREEAQPLELVKEEWHKSFNKTVLKREFQDFSIDKMQQKFSGHIEIRIIELSSSGFIVGEMKSLLQEHTPGKYGHLPKAIFQVKIRINNLESRLHKTALLFLDIIENTSWEDITQKRIDEFREAYELYKKDELIRHEIPKKEFEKIEYLIRELQIDEKEFWNQLGKFIPLISGLTQFERKSNRNFRARINEYLHPTKKDETIVSESDVKQLSDFGDDLFLIFRHFMNLVIKFLKFSEQQTWLNEVNEKEVGYFYTKNRVEMDGRGPFIPNAVHGPASLIQLPKEYIIQKEKWLKIVDKVLTNQDKRPLDLVAGPFHSQALEGMFSRAIDVVEDGYLADAVLLSSAGLEAAMRMTLEYFKIKVWPSRNVVWAIKELLNHGQTIPDNIVDMRKLWKLIEGTPSKNKAKKYHEYSDGLIPVRNQTAHGLHRHKIPQKDGKRIGEYVYAACQMAHILEKWIYSKPPKVIGSTVRQKIKEKREKRKG